MPLIAKFEELQHKAALAKKAIADAERDLASGKIDKIDHFTITSEATKSIEAYSNEIEKLRGEIEVLDNQISPLQQRLESLKFTGTDDASYAEIGEKVKNGLNSASQSVEKFETKTKTSFKSLRSSVDSFGKRVANTFKSAFIFSVLYKGLNELKQRLSAMLSTWSAVFTETR